MIRLEDLQLAFLLRHGFYDTDTGSLHTMGIARIKNAVNPLKLAFQGRSIAIAQDVVLVSGTMARQRESADIIAEALEITRVETAMLDLYEDTTEHEPIDEICNALVALVKNPRGLIVITSEPLVTNLVCQFTTAPYLKKSAPYGEGYIVDFGVADRVMSFKP